jgi:hypothetical protein
MNWILAARRRCGCIARLRAGGAALPRTCPGVIGGTLQQTLYQPSQELAARFAQGATGPMRVIKGGSWLCDPDFCAHDRPAARQPQNMGLGASRVGVHKVRVGPAPR